MSDQLYFDIFKDPEGGVGETKAPGEFIKAELEKRGWSQADFAQILSRPLPTVNEIIKGKRGITPEMAVALGSAFNQPAEIWIHREAAYRLAQVQSAPDKETVIKASLFSEAPVKEMQKRGWISSSKQSAEILKEELEGFWVENIKAVARKSGDDEFSNAQMAWLCRASRLSESLNVRTFSKDKLVTALPKLRTLAGLPERVAHLPVYLAELGVRLVVVEALPRTRIDGAAFYLENNKSAPVIALSLRIDRMESVWHTIGHELFHIVHGDPLSLDSDLVGKEPNHKSCDLEERADKNSTNWLISEKEMASFVRRAGPKFGKASIIQFANRIGIHPSIIVGQLHHRGKLAWSQRNELCPKIKEHFFETALVDGHGYKI